MIIIDLIGSPQLCCMYIHKVWHLSLSSFAPTNIHIQVVYFKWHMHFCLSVSVENGLTPVQMTMALEKQEPNFTEAREQREM